MAAKTESHRKIAEQMSSARARASFPAMSRAEFLAQTPKELRVLKPGDMFENILVVERKSLPEAMIREVCPVETP